jgi:orotate phosphoribosyltransferase
LHRLEALLRQRSVQRGDFVLASGARSSFYIDARPTTMSGEGLALVGALGLERIVQRGWRPQFVGGLTLGADPVAYAIAAAAQARGTPLDAFTVRKEAKQHGAGKRIEGCLATGGRAVIVEDVITTGRSALAAIKAVLEFGASVVGVLAVVDREEGGRESLERSGYEVEALLTARNLLSS